MSSSLQKIILRRANFATLPVELAVDRALSIAGRGAKIGILGSPALRKAAIFENALSNADLSPIYCNDEEGLLAIIRSVKSAGSSVASGHQLNLLANGLVDKGVDSVMICCSEYSVLVDQVQSQMPVFDTLDALVEASVQFASCKTTEHQRVDQMEVSQSLLGVE